MSKTHEQFVDELKNINPEIIIIGKYTKATERIKVKCSNCDKVWEPKAYSLLQGKSCPHCSAVKGAAKSKGRTKLKTHDEFIIELSKIHPNITIQSQYKNTHEDVLCYCNRCETSWKAKPYSLLQGHGCPRCVKSGTSFMEQFIRLSFEYALGETNVISRDKELISMELDIYIPSLKIAIEPGNWYLHKKSINRDKQKREKCSQKGVRLITIYDKFPNDETKPFDNDCFTFSDDLNKTDHSVIRELVLNLFELCEIKNPISSTEFAEIDEKAYSLSKSKTHDEFINEMNDINPNINIIGKYQNSNKRIRVRCEICGNEWEAVPANLLVGDGCRKCGTKKSHQKFIKSQDDFVLQLNKINPNIEIIGEYIGRHSPVKAKCKICGYEWYPVASSLLRGSSHKGSKTIHKRINK